jgi:hypothetical protein
VINETETHSLGYVAFFWILFLKALQKTIAMAFLSTFKKRPLLMESEPKTNRKRFLKMAGLAFGAVFAFATASGRNAMTVSGQQSRSDKMPKEMSRVRAAKGAVVREIS